MEAASEDHFCTKCGCEGKGSWKLERDKIEIGILWNEGVEDKNRNLLIEETFEGFFLPKEGKRDLIHRIASSLGPKGTKVRIICIWERKNGEFVSYSLPVFFVEQLTLIYQER